MTAVKKFLSDFQNQKRTLESLEQGLTSESLVLGKGESALEVALVSSETQPQTSKIRKAYKTRKRNRANPVLLTVIQGEKASVCGPSGDNPPIYKAKPLKIVESFCRSALNQPDRHKALEFCHQFLPSIEEIPGIHNKTLFSSHHLKHGIKRRPDWSQAQQKAQSIQNLGDSLVGIGTLKEVFP